LLPCLALQLCRHHRPHRPLPTRRSSDLLCQEIPAKDLRIAITNPACASEITSCVPDKPRDFNCSKKIVHVSSLSPFLRRKPRIRSEEHTSELQSRFDLVCRLLLEKKKTL